MRAAAYVMTFLAVLVVTGTVAFADGLRDADRYIIDRVLDGPYDDFMFRSDGRKILFADVESTIFQSTGPGEHDHEMEAAANADEGDGCGGGPGGFCMQVLNNRGNVLCWAERPRQPGWMRDPRLACLLDSTGKRNRNYTLRVFLMDEDCGDTFYVTPEDGEVLIYRLKVSLQEPAPEGTMRRAIAPHRLRKP